MILGPSGDLFQSGLLSRRMSAVSADMSRLAQEVSSGRRQDLSAHVDGNFSPLAGIERDLALGTALGGSNAAAARFAAAQQSGLDLVGETVERLGPEFAVAASGGSAHHLATAFSAAESGLSQSISALNTRMDGRAVFAGAATAGPALVDADTLLAGLGAALSGATDAADAMSRADAWFAPGGDFETLAYAGSATPLADMDIGIGATERFGLTAADPALRETLKAQAVAALMGQGLLAGDRAGQADLLSAASGRLTGVVDDLSTLRADIGNREQRIEVERVRNDARQVALDTARSAIADADPYESAIALRQAETQLSAIFQITARLANLSLASVLR